VTRLSDALYRLSTGWVTLLALAVFVVFLVLVLPAQAAVGDAGDDEVGSPDTSFVYTPADLYRTAEAYGAAGRAAYIRARFTFDLIWPLVYAFFLATSISWLLARAPVGESPVRLVNLVPVVGALFDYLENLATSLVMARYPARTPVVDLLAPVLTMIKWIFVGGSFVLLIVGVVAAVVQRLRDRGAGRT
jgi:hypothetical protein